MSKPVSLAEKTAADGSDGGSRDGAQALLDNLALCLADAARQGILLTSGPLSRRKTDWVLAQLSEQIGQAADLIERLKQDSGRSR